MAFVRTRREYPLNVYAFKFHLIAMCVKLLMRPRVKSSVCVILTFMGHKKKIIKVVWLPVVRHFHDQLTADGVCRPLKVVKNSL